VKAGLLACALIITQPLMAATAESRCNVAGDFAVQVKG